MWSILSITLPIFGAIALGYGAVQSRVFSTDDMKVLSRFVLNIALPAMLFSALAQSRPSEILAESYVISYLLAGLSSVALTWAWFKIQGAARARRAAAAMGASCPNSAFVGLPIYLLVLPDQAGVILALNVLVENLAIVPVCLYLFEVSRPQNGMAGRLIAPLLALVKRPMMIGLLSGVAVMFSGLELPDAVFGLTSLIAQAAPALALVVIGGTLAGLPIRGNRADAAQIVAAKLLLHPALAFGAAVSMPLLGLPPLAPEMLLALVLTAALPMFSIYTVLAQDYGEGNVASLAMLGATAASFITLSLLLVAFQAG